MSSLSAFNNQLINLIDNLSKMYPNDPDIQFTKTTVSFIKKTNPRKLSDVFNKYVKQYETKIMEKDEEFLMKNNFIDEKNFNEISNQKMDYAEGIISNLRKYWSSMDDESKENIWKYLQVLILLNNKCTISR